MSDEVVNYVLKLSDSLQKNNLLENISQQFANQHKLIPNFGVEIEFYLSPDIDLVKFEHLLGIRVKPEKGTNQFEVDLPPSNHLTDYAEYIKQIKNKIAKIAKQLGGTVDFSSKPFTNDYGSSMHFHLSFVPKSKLINTVNLIVKSAQSLCYYMLETLIIFIPDKEGYKRLDKNFMAPTHVSYGNNNRTVAIRIPDAVPKRLEHRLPSPAADPYLVMLTMLGSVLLGLENFGQINHLPQTYGNAFDAQYNLVPLPKTRDEALKLFKTKIFNAYMPDNFI